MMLTWSHAKRLPSGFVQIRIPPGIPVEVQFSRRSSAGSPPYKIIESSRPWLYHLQPLV